VVLNVIPVEQLLELILQTNTTTSCLKQDVKMYICSEESPR